MNYRDLSRLITLIETDPLLGREKLKSVEKKNSMVVGITGSPGAGKSTLVDRLIEHFRSDGKSVGVIAVDPSSPFSGGAFLGDRIRMKKHFTDEGVFIRSMASRGSLGGVNDSVFDVVEAYRAYGFDVVLIETVGAGQTEVEIAYVAQTVVLVLSPGSGDEVQMLKAGIMEIADVFVVNKSDQLGADALVLSIRAMLEISERKGWVPPIVQTVATAGKGIDELVKAIEEHHDYLLRSGEMEKRRIRSEKKHAEHIMMNKIREIIEKSRGDDLEEIMEDIRKGICG